MKKLITAVFFVFMLISADVYAGVIGEVLTTDIGTLIDDSPIESYNINDYTYIVAEDLAGYGFDVSWDGDSRTLSINHNVHKCYSIALDKSKINIKKSEIAQREHFANVFSTDIVTYLDGERIDACNIDGKTLIQVDYLARYGEFYYDNTKRMVEIRIMKPSFEYGIKTAENRVDGVVDFYPGKLRRRVGYLGTVDENGSPFGIGRVTDKYGMISVTYAYWDGYTKRDTYYEEAENYAGKLTRTYGYESGGIPHTIIELYGTGDSPYTMTATERYEQSGSYCREGTYDSDYLYGFYITKEGNLEYV